MLRLPLDRGGNAQEILRRRCIDADDIGDLGATRRDRTGLVDGHRLDLGQVLEMCPALDQHAATRGLRDACQHRRRCSERERARRRADEHRHAGVDARRPVAPAGERWNDDQQRIGHEHRGHEDALEPFRQVLRRRLLRLRFGDERDDSIERAIAGRARGRHLDRAVTIHGAREHVITRSLVDRHGLTGDWRLIDGGLAGLDTSVHGNALTGPHEHTHAGAHILDRHEAFSRAVDDARKRRRQIAERGNRAARAAEGVVLECVRKREQEQQERPLRDLANRRRAGGRQQHQEIDIELHAASNDTGKRLPDEPESTKYVGGGVKRQRDRCRQAEPVLADPGNGERDARREAARQPSDARVARIGDLRQQCCQVRAQGSDHERS